MKPACATTMGVTFFMASLISLITPHRAYAAAYTEPHVFVFHTATPIFPTMRETTKQLTTTPETLDTLFHLLHDLHIPTLTMHEYLAVHHAHKKFLHHRVVLTFDDGTTDFYTTVLPLLKRYKLRATLYANPGFDGTEGRMTLKMLSEVSTCGCVEIGAHTLTHQHLTFVSEEQVREEVVGSKQMLEKLIKKPVSTFAYPYGETNARVTRIVKEAGFTSAVIADNILQPTDDFLLPRISVGESSIDRATEFLDEL